MMALGRPVGKPVAVAVADCSDLTLVDGCTRMVVGSHDSESVMVAVAGTLVYVGAGLDLTPSEVLEALKGASDVDDGKVPLNDVGTGTLVGPADNVELEETGGSVADTGGSLAVAVADVFVGESEMVGV